MDCPTLPKMFFRSISWPPQVGPNEKSLRRPGGFGNNTNENSTGKDDLLALRLFIVSIPCDFRGGHTVRLQGHSAPAYSGRPNPASYFTCTGQSQVGH